MIKFIKNLFKSSKQQCNIPAVSNSVVCDSCNDYGYIVITFSGKSAHLRCPKCDGKSAELNCENCTYYKGESYHDKMWCRDCQQKNHFKLTGC